MSRWEDELDAFASQYQLSPPLTTALRRFVSTLQAQTEASESPRPPTVDRYVDMGVIGTGSFGEVRRVVDKELNRTMAMKILHPRIMEQDSLVARFVEEAQATAQLQHPGIVPVHELGQLRDGRRYFTMKEVRGLTFKEVLSQHHRGTGAWTFRRLISAFHDVCEAVAFAHARGVIHRDLKPSNIMVGDFGEVLVMDWGLAKVIQGATRGDSGATPTGAEDPDAVVTDRSLDRANATLIGTVAGTPVYMPPEQARGQVHRLAPPSDVYSLGAILYAILSGRPPYQGPDAMDIIEQVRAGPPPVLPEGVDAELASICDRAMHRDMDGRYPDAQGMARDVAAWLDGERRQEQARGVVADAEEHLPRIARLRAHAAELHERAQVMLAEVQPWDPEGAKRRAWTLQDRAAGLEREAELLQVRIQQALHGALNIAPTLWDAHEALAERYRAEHDEAVDARDAHRAARSLEHLKAHALALPEDNPNRRRLLAWLEGKGRVTLTTDPPAANVRLLRYGMSNRKLEPKLVDFMGEAPLVEHPLDMGSWCLELVYEGRAHVRYPVFLGRQESWDGCPPGSTEPARVLLPREEALGEDDCYVPAGWFISGGDPDALSGLPRRRLWADGFVMKRTAVTHAQFIAFLDALVDAGRGDEALVHAPHQDGRCMYGRDADGHFTLVPDAEGDLWSADWPVWLVDWHGARAYARWLAEVEGAGWRLPMELEWEKAARGVDGRFFPWGDQHDPSWCRMRDSHDGALCPAAVGTYRVDTSPYGVCDLAGNIREWCQDVFHDHPVVDGLRVQVLEQQGDGRRSVRGGRYSGPANACRVADRSSNAPGDRKYVIGFRLARSV